MKELTADELAELADRFTKLSTQLFEFRVTHSLTAEEEHLLRVECEQKLDALANVLRGQAIALVVTDAGLKSGALLAALASAGKTLEKLDKVRDVIGLVTNVIALGGAVLSGNAKAILKALKGFRQEDDDGAEAEEDAAAT